jgi:hypothetical protein
MQGINELGNSEELSEYILSGKFKPPELVSFYFTAQLIVAVFISLILLLNWDLVKFGN